MKHTAILRWPAVIVAMLMATAGLGADATDDLALPKDLPQELLLDRYATPQSTFAYLNRTLVHYRDEGRGPAVLLIHGSLQDLYDWDAWTRALSPSHRVIRLDLPSSGLTGRVGSGDYSIDNTMRTIDALLERLGERRVAVVGTSIGGVVAFRYAATRPDQVGALVLMNSAGLEWGNEKIIPPQPQRYNESLAPKVSRADVRTILAAVLQGEGNIPAGRLDRGFDYLRRQGREAESAAMVGAYQRGKPEEVLAQVRAPVLLLWGGANRALDPSVADRFAAALLNAQRVDKMIVAKAGHWPHVEAPTESVAFVQGFLARRFDATASGSAAVVGMK